MSKFRSALSAVLAGLALLTTAFFVGNGPVSAQTGDIAVSQSSSPNGSWFCLDYPLNPLGVSSGQTGLTFTVTITQGDIPLCTPLAVNAVVYAMPVDGSVWPQTLREKQTFTLPAHASGTTTVTFQKQCFPAQFDVLTGDTPRTVDPTGPWHGPLLTPFAPNQSALQWPGGGQGCNTTTTDSTTSTTEATTTTEVPPTTETTVEPTTTTEPEVTTTTAAESTTTINAYVGVPETTVVQVLEPASPSTTEVQPSAQLARTGAPFSITLALAGAALLGLGALLIVTSKRRTA